MSKETIRKGDLVIVVRCPGCCAGAEKFIGRIFTVTELATNTIECSVCKHRTESALCAKTGLVSPNGKWIGYHVAWLKKIPPMDAIEYHQTEEKTRMPV